MVVVRSDRNQGGMATLSICYEGKVQGIGFRATVLSLAKGFEIRGWIKNLPDGGVELLSLIHI